MRKGKDPNPEPDPDTGGPKTCGSCGSGSGSGSGSPTLLFSTFPHRYLLYTNVFNVIFGGVDLQISPVPTGVSNRDSNLGLMLRGLCGLTIYVAPYPHILVYILTTKFVSVSFFRVLK
jgi:hypothetical protein